MLIPGCTEYISEISVRSVYFWQQWLPNGKDKYSREWKISNVLIISDYILQKCVRREIWYHSRVWHCCHIRRRRLTYQKWVVILLSRKVDDGRLAQPVAAPSTATDTAMMPVTAARSRRSHSITRPLCKAWTSGTRLVSGVKVQFRGPELFKKKGALFQKELYLPGIFMPPWTSWRYDCGLMASVWM